MNYFDAIHHVLICLAALAICLGMTALGYRLASRMSRTFDQDDRGVIDMIHGSLLGLLALLLGFSFAMSAGRFDTRRQLVLDEANALGTAVLRSELLPSPHDTAIRSTLLRYVDARVQFAEAGTDPQVALAAEQLSIRLHREIWDTLKSFAADPRSLGVLPMVATSINELIDLQAKRAASLDNHVPLIVWALLFGATFAGVFGLGFRCGLARRRLSFATTFFSLLLCTVLFVVIDLDRPFRGLVKISHQPLLDLQKSLR